MIYFNIFWYICIYIYIYIYVGICWLLRVGARPVCTHPINLSLISTYIYIHIYIHLYIYTHKWTYTNNMSRTCLNAFSSLHTLQNNNHYCVRLFVFVWALVHDVGWQARNAQRHTTLQFWVGGVIKWVRKLMHHMSHFIHLYTRIALNLLFIPETYLL